MDFYIELTDEEIEFIKYVLTLSKNFAKQIFKSKVIFTKAVITPNGKCLYNVEQTSNGPRICIKVTPYDKDCFTAFPEAGEFGYHYSSYNPWTNKGVRVEICSAEEASRRRKVDEFKKLIPTATFLREVVLNYGVCWHRINHAKTQNTLEHNKLYIMSSWIDGEIEEKDDASYHIEDIVDQPEIFALYSMIPTEAITEDIKSMLE